MFHLSIRKKSIIEKRGPIIVLMCIISTVLITACAEQQQKTSPTPKFSVTKSPQAPMPPEDIEEKLNEEIDKGKILAIYENPLIATSIAEKKNYVMIKNAYEQPKGFGIGLDCTVCTIEEKTVNISAKSTATIPFMVKKGVKAGRYNAKIVIKDDRNNFYATEEIDIIVAPR